jgi:hypothetical protein
VEAAARTSPTRSVPIPSIVAVKGTWVSPPPARTTTSPSRSVSFPTFSVEGSVQGGGRGSPVGGRRSTRTPLTAMVSKSATRTAGSVPSTVMRSTVASSR